MPVRALPIHRWGGLELHTLDLARALARLGHDVTLIASARPASSEGEQQYDGLRVCYLPHGSPGDYSFSFFRELNRAILRLDDAQRFDIIHAQEFAGLFIGSFPNRFISTVHGTMFSETPLDRRYWRRMNSIQQTRAIWRYKMRIALHPFFKRMLDRADRLIVDSDFTWREICRMAPRERRKLRLVPLGIDSTRYNPIPKNAAPPPTGHTFTIALLGRIQEIKGLGVVVKAAQILRERRVNFRMIIGGSGRYSSTLRDAIRENRLEDYVDLRGPVPPESLASFMAEADVFLFPDLTQPAFGLVAIEAIHHGLPVIAARSGAIPEVVGDAVGWIYDPWNPAELASLIGHLAQNPTEVDKKIPALSSAREYYTADRMAADIEKVYFCLLSGRM